MPVSNWLRYTPSANSPRATLRPSFVIRSGWKWSTTRAFCRPRTAPSSALRCTPARRTIDVSCARAFRHSFCARSRTRCNASRWRSVQRSPTASCGQFTAQFTPQNRPPLGLGIPDGAPRQLAFVNPAKPPPHPVCVFTDAVGEYVPGTKPRQRRLEGPVHFARTVQVRPHIREYAPELLRFVPTAGGLVFPGPCFHVADAGGLQLLQCARQQLTPDTPTPIIRVNRDVVNDRSQVIPGVLLAGEGNLPRLLLVFNIEQTDDLPVRLRDELNRRIFVRLLRGVHVVVIRRIEESQHPAPQPARLVLRLVRSNVHPTPPLPRPFPPSPARPPSPKTAHPRNPPPRHPPPPPPPPACPRECPPPPPPSPPRPPGPPPFPPPPPRSPPAPPGPPPPPAPPVPVEIHLFPPRPA